MQAFSGCGDWGGYALVVACELLIAVTFLFAEHRF